jgi:hypothetical protein
MKSKREVVNGVQALNLVWFALIKYADGTFIYRICGAWVYPYYSDSHNHDRPNEA